MARYFDGIDNILRYDMGYTISPTAPFTVSWLGRIDNYGSTRYLWNIECTNTPMVGAYCYTAGGDSLYFAYFGSSEHNNRITTAQTVVGFGVNHLAWVYAGSGSAGDNKIYLNGAPVSTTNTNGSGLFDTATGFIDLGNRNTDSARPFDGTLAELGVWNRALSAGEIAQLAAGFSPLTIPKGLKFAPRLAGTELLDPITGKLPTTTTGTTIAAHPSRVKWRSASNVYWPNPATAPSGFKPAWWTPPKLIGAGF